MRSLSAKPTWLVQFVLPVWSNIFEQHVSLCWFSQTNELTILHQVLLPADMCLLTRYWCYHGPCLKLDRLKVCVQWARYGHQFTQLVWLQTENKWLTSLIHPYAGQILLVFCAVSEGVLLARNGHHGEKQQEQPPNFSYLSLRLCFCKTFLWLPYWKEVGSNDRRSTF